MAHEHHQNHNHLHHSHHHHLHHDSAVQTVGKVFKISIVLNLAFVAVEFVAGFLSDSVGLMSDAGHNLSDVLSLVIAWVAVVADRRKTTLAASCVNSALLLLAVGVIFVESIGKLISPEPADGKAMIVVAAIGVAVNLITTLLLRQKDDGNLNVRGAFLHMLADTLVSVGVVVAGIVILRTDCYIIDPLIGLAVGTIVLVMTVGYIREIIREAKKHDDVCSID